VVFVDLGGEEFQDAVAAFGVGVKSGAAEVWGEEGQG
jgi:hypothetical protein